MQALSTLLHAELNALFEERVACREQHKINLKFDIYVSD